jgi:STE24 endopeptidase
VSRAARYERFVHWNWVLSQVALVAVLAVYARKGAAFVRQSAAGRIGTGMLLGMLGLALVWLVQLPFGLAGHWWDRRHHLTDEGYVAWAFSGWAELGAAFLSICLALLIVMAIAGKLPNGWWLPGAAVFVAIGTAFQLALPYLITAGTDPLRDPQLVAAARQQERAQGLSHVPVRVEDVGDTKLVNAYAVGIGPSRRVVLWSTLVDGYPRPEVKVVLAHELAHHSSDHLPKGIAWYALLAVPGTWLIARATRRRGGMARPEAVPLGLLVVVVLELAAVPLQNVIGRRMESEADWKALQTTHDPTAARRLFTSFARDDLADPNPPTWAYLLFESHPTLAQRVAMVNAWAARR